MYMREFVADVNQMFENAKKYNPPDHAIFKCAESMQQVFERKLREIRLEMTKIHQNDANFMRNRLNSESHHTLEGSLDIEADQLLPIGPNAFEYEDYLANFGEK
ncbi:unnamed protein product [Caenorhabditis angaria]|uniref:Bromo domain-containing protein n=1 Tax=Caenorhabditis angaria TaxID=860376 RepID=A0A9P1MXQ9_9PELO|nr:unnamed protein product [Caenorhabditis angaria]